MSQKKVKSAQNNSDAIRNQQFVVSTVQSLNALVQRRKSWEQGDFKKANELLYQLLADSYETFTSKFLNADAACKTLMRAELSALLKVSGVRVQSNTTTLTMVVRYVFGSDRKRAHGYTYVIKAAISHGISSGALPDWIAEQGGIEEIKRKMVVSEEAIARKERLEAARLEVLADIEQSIIKPLGQLKMTGVRGEYALLLARPSPDGILAIIGAISNVEKSLYNSCVLKMARRKAVENAQSLLIPKESSDLLAKSIKLSANDKHYAKKAIAA